MERIFQTLAKQTNGLVETFLCKRLFGQLHTGYLVLSGHLAFATFPRMELVGVELLLGLLVTTKLVEQGDFLQHEVIALLDESGVFL